MLDTKRLAETMVSGAKAYIDKALAGLLPRLEALENRAPEKGDTGDRGLDGGAGRDGKDGRDGTDGIGLAEIVRDAEGNLIAVMSDGRTKTIGNILVRDGVDGKDGRDGVDGQPGERGAKGADGSNGNDGRDGDSGRDGADGENGKDGRDGVDGLNGKDAPAPTEDQIVSAILGNPGIIDAAVQRYLSSNPPTAGRDGKDGERGLDGKNGADGRDGQDGADGIGLAAAVQDADGNLVITDTKGGVHKVGRVRGIDGERGQDGLHGKDGADGAAGRDGFSLSDFDAEMMEDGRTILLSFARGDQEYKVELGIPAMIYRGVWKDGQRYEKGDTVTWGGSLWHCDAGETAEKPDGSEKHWTLAAKRGRDGKDGSPGEKGERGVEGKAGRDLTQLGPGGEKW